MQVQLNTDKHIKGDDALAGWVERELKDKLARHREHITRVEVHLSDASPTRHGPDDKCCKLEARLTGRQPVLASHEAATVAEAFRGALDKLLRVIDTQLGRVKEAHLRDSIRGETGTAPD